MKQWRGTKLAFEVWSHATRASHNSHDWHFTDQGTDSGEGPSGRITPEAEYLWLRAQVSTLIIKGIQSLWHSISCGIQSLVPSLFPECRWVPGLLKSNTSTQRMSLCLHVPSRKRIHVLAQNLGNVVTPGWSPLPPALYLTPHSSSVWKFCSMALVLRMKSLYWQTGVGPKVSYPFNNEQWLWHACSLCIPGKNLYQLL